MFTISDADAPVLLLALAVLFVICTLTKRLRKSKVRAKVAAGILNHMLFWWTPKDPAAAIHRSESSVSMTLSLSRCIQPVKDAANEGKVGLKDRYAMSQAGEEQQLQMLQARLGGATAEQVKRIVRKAANAVRTSKVKCAMPSGVTVTLAGEGEGMTLADVIETLAELLKEAKRAEGQGLDASTFSAVLRDKAKVGS